MAAVLALGDGAALSHRDAAVLWGMLPARRPSKGGRRVDVTIPSHAGRAQRQGIRVHRSSTLSPSDVTLREGIPVTSAARTLQDLRSTLPSTVFASALRRAEFHGLPIDDFPTDHTRSELESRFVALLRRHGLPPPEVNVRVDRFVVDFLWPGRRLIVELDGWQAHGARSAFEADRERDARLNVLGYAVLRFTWRQVEDKGAAVAQTVRELLGR
jgi:very-short-patch-repair endonuclease